MGLFDRLRGLTPSAAGKTLAAAGAEATRVRMAHDRARVRAGARAIRAQLGLPEDPRLA